MGRIYLHGGRVIDPSVGLDRVTSLLIDNGRIVGTDLPAPDDAQCFDVAGKIIAPGLIDLHVHMREPGREDEETIASGTRAALRGGFTSVACLPDTDPPIDSAAAVEFLRLQADRAGHCHVWVVATVSKNREGKDLSEMGQLRAAGAVAFSDASEPIHNAGLMRRALEYSQMFQAPILNLPDVRELTAGGVMHEGTVSLLLGLPGLPAAAETVMVARDVLLSETTGGQVHLMQLSAAESLEVVRRAKSRGVRITAEVSPLHFTLTDELLRTFDASYKVYPPLRSSEDVNACRRALADGTIDCIASGHAPHAAEKKMQELDLAPFGAVGLETTLALVITELIEPGFLDWPTALAKLTCHPARVLGLDRGTLQPGRPADVTVIDPTYPWTIDPETFASKCKNTPLAGRRVRGRAEMVLVDGIVKFIAQSA